MNDAQGERLTKFFKILFGFFGICLVVLGAVSWAALFYKFAANLNHGSPVSYFLGYTNYFLTRKDLSAFLNPFSGLLLITVGLWMLSLVFPKSFLNIRLGEKDISWIFSTIVWYLFGYGIVLLSAMFLLGFLLVFFWPVYILFVWKILRGLSPKKRNLVLVLIALTVILHFEILSAFFEHIFKQIF